jgi:hypothetical protein
MHFRIERRSEIARRFSPCQLCGGPVRVVFKYCSHCGRRGPRLPAAIEKGTLDDYDVRLWREHPEYAPPEYFDPPINPVTGERSPAYRDDLQEPKAPVAPGRNPPLPGGLSIDGNYVTYKGITYLLKDAPAAIFRALIEATPGVWVAGNEIELARPRPDRVVKQIPKPLRDLIESKVGKGYRIRRT